MKYSRFDSVSLRNVLIFIVTVMIIALAGGFYFAQGWLNDYAIEVNKTSSELASKDTAQVQSQLKSELSGLRLVAEKASSIAAPSSNYLGGVTKDINRYASSTGIGISSITPSEPPVGVITPNVVGIKTKYVKVALANPVSFDGLIKFIKAIESNIPKMRLTGISLSHNDQAGDKISVEPITLEVFIK